MNVLLKNIFEQPYELNRVLTDLCTDKLDQVRELSRKMTMAKEIVLTSMGSAFYSLMPMYEALLEAGCKNVSLVETADLIQHPERMSKNAFYIMMSRSGESREVADFSKYLKENGYISLAITMTPTSTMGTHCTYMLHDISSYDAIVCIKAYSSMSLCGLFLVHMMGRENPDPEFVAKLHQAFDWLEENKEKIHEQVAAIPVYTKAHNFYLVSRGYGINMMRSLSLWTEETAKMTSNIMSLDNYYHGPMEIIRYQSQIKTVTVPILLDILPSERSKMIWGKTCAATDLNVYFGPEGGEAIGSTCLTYPEFGLPGACVTLIIAMYFQLFSYECALQNGINPGEFQDEGWVVL
ncbi:MAG: SIS domain-containing protein [Oscillospiraceae bacterium]|nr:SIS domain-containing protein [Oscillospiraceae bacterium]